MLIADHAFGNAMCSEGLIAQIGNGMDAAGLCGREDWRLPAVLKPGLDATGDVVFPDAGTAGRQIFRLLYSLVSAATLAAAWGAFTQVGEGASVLIPVAEDTRPFLFAAGALSSALSLISLGNASPLSLVPSFQPDTTSPSGFTRNDSAKLYPHGLTRITRHPLILPMVPWGLANGLLVGGRAQDLILFWGIAVYSVCGCWAQVCARWMLKRALVLRSLLCMRACLPAFLPSCFRAFLRWCIRAFECTHTCVCRIYVRSSLRRLEPRSRMGRSRNSINLLLLSRVLPPWMVGRASGKLCLNCLLPDVCLGFWEEWRWRRW